MCKEVLCVGVGFGSFVDVAFENKVNFVNLISDDFFLGELFYF